MALFLWCSRSDYTAALLILQCAYYPCSGGGIRRRCSVPHYLIALFLSLHPARFSAAGSSPTSHTCFSLSIRTHIYTTLFFVLQHLSLELGERIKLGPYSAGVRWRSDAAKHAKVWQRNIQPCCCQGASAHSALVGDESRTERWRGYYWYHLAPRYQAQVLFARNCTLHTPYTTVKFMVAYLTTSGLTLFWNTCLKYNPLVRGPASTQGWCACVCEWIWKCVR